MMFLLGVTQNGIDECLLSDWFLHYYEQHAAIELAKPYWHKKFRKSTFNTSVLLIQGITVSA